jgi:steroid 5-alpha reductase family enzyme
MTEKNKGRLILLAVYTVAFGTGYRASVFCNGGILLQSAVAAAVAVVIIFAGSIVFNNSSVFDPYWSVVPPLMVLFYLVCCRTQQSWDIRAAGHIHWLAGKRHLNGMDWLLYQSPRIMLLFLLTLIYSVRLTWNFLRGWPGLSHEDWRYAGFRANTGKAYWLVSFAGIHFFPALMVFGGTLAVWVTVVQGFRPMNFMDIAAILVTGNAIMLETVADRQLRKFTLQNKETGKTMNLGLWAVSRHPNYLGEILFWWGLYLFALAANPAFWWIFIGPAGITLMFIFASIPMIEKRMLNRRKDYEVYRKTVSMLVPWKSIGNR